MHLWQISYFQKERQSVRATTRTGYMMTSPKFSTWRPNQGTRSRVTFQLFATPRNDLFPQYFRSCAFEWWGTHECEKKWQPMKFCVFSRGKTTENGSVSARRSTWQGAKHLKIKGVCQFFDLGKKCFEIYIKFACWRWFCLRSAKHLHIVLCVWIYNSELRHVRIFVTPCSFCFVAVWWKSTLFFWHKDAVWVTKLYRKSELSGLCWLVQGAM